MNSPKFLLFFVTLIVLAFAVQGFAQQTETDWEAFSVNLEKALKSGHPGLQQSAMQRIIAYGDKLSIDDGVYYIGRIFCYGTDAQERRLALIALAKINTMRSMGYIYKGMVSENNDSIKKQSCCILNDYCLANAGTTMEDFRLALQ
jgi:hypothetical protein